MLSGRAEALRILAQLPVIPQFWMPALWCPGLSKITVLQIHSSDAKLHHPSEATGTKLVNGHLEIRHCSAELVLLPGVSETSSSGLGPLTSPDTVLREYPFLLCSHRIIACSGLEAIFRGHPAQTPCREQGHLQLDQVAQSPIQPGPECFQGWGLHYLSLQSVPVFHHHGKKILPYIQSKSTLP